MYTETDVAGSQSAETKTAGFVSVTLLMYVPVTVHMYICTGGNKLCKYATTNLLRQKVDPVAAYCS